MNNARRKHIAQLINLCREVQERIEFLESEENEYHENMPDAFRDGEKGERAEAVIYSLQQASEGVDEVAAHLEEAAE